MSIYKGTTLIASGLPVAGFPLFYHTFQDHVLNNSSWLRADTFSWQDGGVYVSAYNHLVDDISGITSETETISGTTITFYRATDGHKIVLADQESNVSAIFNSTGVAWYYILDTVNTRFKLPRSKWNFVGLRDNAGNYVAESLPNITGKAGGVTTSGEISGAFKSTDISTPGYFSGGGSWATAELDASLSSPTYQNDAPVQQRATQAYLYFYVGNTVQDQTTIDVGQITDALNGKVDLANGVNQADVDYVVESYQSGTSWYRLYKSGWCEQGGYISALTTNYTQYVLLKQYKDTNYSIFASYAGINGNTSSFSSIHSIPIKPYSTSKFITAMYGATESCYWQASGYIR